MKIIVLFLLIQNIYATYGCHDVPTSCHKKWPTAWCDPGTLIVSGYSGLTTKEKMTWVNDSFWCYYYHCDSGTWVKEGECQPRSSGSGLFCNYRCKLGDVKEKK